METYNYNNGNSTSNSRRPKIITLSINNRSGYFEQVTKLLMMIQIVFDDAEISDVLRY